MDEIDRNLGRLRQALRLREDRQAPSIEERAREPNPAADAVAALDETGAPFDNLGLPDTDSANSTDEDLARTGPGASMSTPSRSEASWSVMGTDNQTASAPNPHRAAAVEPDTGEQAPARPPSLFLRVKSIFGLR